MPKENIFSDNSLGSFIENQFGDRFLYSVNGSSFDKIGAHAVYRKQWGDSLFAENTLYLVVGSDSGILPAYIERIGIPEGSRYLFVELEEIIPLVADSISENNIADKKMLVSSASNWLETAKSQSLVEYAYLDAIQLIPSLAVSDAHLLAYSDFWRELEQEFQNVLWIYQREFGTLTFITRTIENLAENRHSAAALINQFQGKTAVILAGGPSLDELLPWVQQNRKRLTVVAVSRISKRLLELNLEPDIVVTVDPHYCSYEVSKHMLRLKSALLVNAYHATPVLVSQWQGRSLYLDSRLPWACLEKEIVLGEGPTVSNSAISLCIAMGFSQIVFLGLDLCYSQEGFSHAKGSLERNSGAFVAFGSQTVETNEGKTAETDNGFYLSVSVIERQVQTAKASGIRFINPSPSAAKMKNVDFVPVENIVLPTQEYKAGDIIQQILPVDNADSKVALYQETITDLEQQQRNISKLIRYANDALKYNDGLFGRNGLKKNFKYKIKMDKLEKKIAKEVPEIAKIAKIYGMTDFVKTLRPDETKKWSDEEVEQTAKLFYNAYIHGAEKLSRVIDQELDRLKVRLEEESDSPDISYLVERWTADHSLGRAKLWIKNHPDLFVALPEQLKTLLNNSCQQFEDEIDDDNLIHRKAIQRCIDLTPVISKLRNLMHHKDIPAMHRLFLSLSTREDDEAAQLALLVKAHIAECENDMDQAVKIYNRLVELDVQVYSRIIEIALIRLSVLSMNCGELDLAAECLNSLSALSHAYMPYYAEALRLSDHPMDAIDVYTEYLSKVPEDLATMMKLGLLYKSIGVKDGAAWLFDYVYKKDPDNAAAKRLLDELELSA